MSQSDNSSKVSFKDALLVWIRVALYSFGGPAGQISVMHKIIIEEKKWIGENRFLHALNYCMLLPGPEAQQLTIYIGWLLHKIKGGLTAGILFVLPGFISILLLSILYALYQETVFLQIIFFGLKAAILAIVVEALIRLGKKALKNNIMYAIAALAFISIFFFNIPFPIIIISAGIIGFAGGKISEENFYIIKSDKGKVNEDREIYQLTEASPSWIYSIKIILIFGMLWMLPLLLLWYINGSENIFLQQGLFFSKAAVVTFGGAYAVLAYISQEAVESYGWLKPGEMLDGLGLAETTPGPLIQVVQFVAFMGAFRFYESADPVLAGILASIIVTWVTFIPSFLWIFLGAPFIERLRQVKLLNTSLSAITAAVAGVILNLAVWFFLQTIFTDINIIYYGFLRLYLPDLSTLNVSSLAITAAAFIALIKYKAGLFKVILGSIIAGIILSLI